jgi:hypothetical protein
MNCKINSFKDKGYFRTMKRCMRSPLFQRDLSVRGGKLNREEKMGTLRVPDVVPSADQDCERLKKAFDGVSSCHCVHAMGVLLLLLISGDLLLFYLCVFVAPIRAD